MKNQLTELVIQIKKIAKEYEACLPLDEDEAPWNEEDFIELGKVHGLTEAAGIIEDYISELDGIPRD